MGKARRFKPNSAYAKSQRLKGKSATGSDDEDQPGRRKTQFDDSDDGSDDDLLFQSGKDTIAKGSRKPGGPKRTQLSNKILLNEEDEDESSEEEEDDEEGAEGVFEESDDYEDDDEEEDEELGADIDRRLKHLEAQSKKEDMASDLEDEGDDDEDEAEAGLPNSMAWGKSRKAYYSADYVDKDYRKYTAQEEEMALAEQREAENIEKRLLQEMDMDDPLSAWLGPIKKIQESKKTGQDDQSKSVSKEIDTTVECDVSSLSLQQKMDLVRKDSPEFWPLLDDYERYSGAVTGLATVAAWYTKASKATSKLPDDCPIIIRHALTKYHLIGRYLTNISFYIYLKASSVKAAKKVAPSSRIPALIEHLIKFKKLIIQLEEMESSSPAKLAGPLEDLIQRATSDSENLSLSEFDPALPKEVEAAQDTESKKAKTEGRRKVHFDEELPEDQAEDDQDEDEDEEDDEEGGKRAISQEMLRNRGLTPKRKKEQRNPRVKHRNRFRRAQVRRKGQVRGVRPSETGHYGGETSGIRSSTVRSIKFKR